MGLESKPHHKPDSAAAKAAAQDAAAHKEYRGIVHDLLHEAWDPKACGDPKQMMHQYDKDIHTKREAVAYAAQTLKFCRDPYTEVILNEKVFPAKSSGFTGVLMKYAPDGVDTHGADNKPVGPNSLQTVDTVYPNTPAAKAGLAKGDQITRIDGRSVAGFTPNEVQTLLNGVAGTKVTMGVVHNGQPREIVITRQGSTDKAPDAAAPADKQGKIGINVGFLKANLKEVDHDAGASTRANRDVQSPQLRQNDYMVENVMPGGAGDKAGLKRGDAIRKIDGHSIAGETSEQIVGELGGKIGSGVDLTIVRNGKEQTVHVVRDKMPDVNVSYKDLGGGIEYIKIASFGKTDTAEELRKAFAANSKAKGFVLDLRNNPGGYVNQAEDVLQLMVKDGTLYTEKIRVDSDPAKPQWKDVKASVTPTQMIHSDNLLPESRHQQYILDGRPLAVLIDRGSASASEIVTGALHDNHIGTTFGVKSYGKGIGQTNWPEKDGLYSLKLTTFQYRNPSGFWPGDANKHRIGLTPDHVVEDDISKGDPQLIAARNWMRKQVQ